MQDESVYGLVYKAIREERGFTQKEAAGTTVTPHFLRQFEQGKSRITIQKFEEILSNIGIDKETFDSLKTQMFPTEFHKLQAQVAESAGRGFFATNLRRAGELIPVPDARLLEIYNALRPYRSTKAELYAIGDELINEYGATVSGNFVKEAADIYEKRNRLRK